MGDDAEKSDGIDYLPVLRMWARAEFLRLSAAIADARTEAEQKKGFDDLGREAPKLTAILIGVDVISSGACEACMNDQVEVLAERIDELLGQLGVARDLFEEILRGPTFTAAHAAAVREWIADVCEASTEVESGTGQEPESTN